VNGIFDQQQKEAYAQSISFLAKKFDFPRWFVDLRHEATHGLLPSLEVLELFADEALEWLRLNYWEAQLDVVRNLKEDMDCRILKYFLHAIEADRKESIKTEKYGRLLLEKEATKVFASMENLKTSFLIRKLLINRILTALISSSTEMALDALECLLKSFQSFVPELASEFLYSLIDFCVSFEIDQKLHARASIFCFISEILADFLLQFFHQDLAANSLAVKRLRLACLKHPSPRFLA
jgi:hypothetical protein